MKCLEKEPSKRYASAHALAEDLERFLRNEPIRSRRSSQLERVRRWCKRKPLVASLIALLILVVAVAMAGVLWELPRVQKERELVRRANLSAQETARLEAEQTNNPAAYEAYLRGRAFAFAAGSQLVESDPDGAIRSFQEAVKLDPSFALAWAYLSCVQSERSGYTPSMQARRGWPQPKMPSIMRSRLVQIYRKRILLLAIIATTGGVISPGRSRNSGEPNKLFRMILISPSRSPLSNGGWDIGKKQLRSSVAQFNLTPVTFMRITSSR